MMLLVSLHAEQYLVALTCYVPGGGSGERQCAVEWPSPHLPHRRFLYLLYRATLRLRTLPFSPVLSFHAPVPLRKTVPQNLKSVKENSTVSVHTRTQAVLESPFSVSSALRVGYYCVLSLVIARADTLLVEVVAVVVGGVLGGRSVWSFL